jgi:MFS family permease
MRLDTYRTVFALPGVRTLILAALLARVPVTAAGITLTLHVVLGLERGYAAAGLVGAAFTIGAAVGAPLLGRLVDRRGLRAMLVLTVIAEAVFWSVAPLLPFPGLLLAALLGGLLSIPVFSTIRQTLAALVPEEHRKQAYSIDSMSVELSFMVGPAVAVLAVTQISTAVAAWLVGGAICLAGIGLWRLNPPVVGADETAARPERPVPRRTWLRPRFGAVLLATVAATIILAGTDVGVVAILKDGGQVQWTGLVLAVWGMSSLLGGFVYGAVPQSPHPLLLAALLGLATIPIGLAAGWGWLCLLLLPAGVLCAPTLAATADAVSRLVPAQARGEAMGLHGSGLTVGMALGAPFAGAIVDAFGPGWAFAAVGMAGLLLAAIGLIGSRDSGSREPVAGPAVRAIAGRA